VTTIQNKTCLATVGQWIEADDVGAVSFNEACGYLGWDADHVRRAIFSAARAA